MKKRLHRLQITDYGLRIILLTAYCLLFSGMTFAGRVDLFSAENHDQAIELTNELKTVVAFTNNFIEQGKLLVFAEAMAHTSYGNWQEPFEAQFGLRQNGGLIYTSMHYQDGFTNRTGFASTSISMAEVLDISPGENIIDFQVRIRNQAEIYLSEPVMNMIFVPDAGSVVSCFVARVDSTLNYDASNEWLNIVSTNMDLSAGEYFIVGTAAVAPGFAGSSANFYVRPNIMGYQLPEAEVDLKGIGDDGMDRSIVVSRGNQILNSIVTNFSFRIRTPYDNVKIYRSALFIIYQPLNMLQPEIQIDYAPGPTNWYWSNSNSNFEEKAVFYNEPRKVLQVSSFTLFTTSDRCLAKTHLLWNGYTYAGFGREEELDNGINLPYCYPGHSTWLNDFASGSHSFSMQVSHGFFDLPSANGAMVSPSRWQSAISVPIPEPFHLSFMIYYLLFIKRKYN